MRRPPIRPKYKDQFLPRCASDCGIDAEKAAQVLLSGNPIEVDVEGQKLEILPDEVEVRVQAKTGFSVASDGAEVAALVTTLSDDLVHEGLAREFVRRVQEARKQANLEIADRIVILSCQL